MNSNTFQDGASHETFLQVRQSHAPDAAVRRQAITHNLDLASDWKGAWLKGAHGWIGDGGNFPGAAAFFAARWIVTCKAWRDLRRAADDWRCSSNTSLRAGFLSTVITIGEPVTTARANWAKGVLSVDLGHHAPNVNIEMIVARLIQFGKLAGFHFNDSKYGDDDLDSGSIKPFQLF